jgi:hypothetical protein
MKKLQFIKWKKIKNLKIKYYWDSENRFFTYMTFNEKGEMVDDGNYLDLRSCEGDSEIWAWSIIAGDNGPLIPL